MIETTASVTAELFQQTDEIFGMFFFHRENAFQHSTRGGIVVGEEADDLAIAVDGDPLRHEGPLRSAILIERTVF
jgi:hypothetical protein